MRRWIRFVSIIHLNIADFWRYSVRTRLECERFGEVGDVELLLKAELQSFVRNRNSRLPGGTLIVDGSRLNETEASCVGSFREGRGKVFGVCYMPHHPEMIRKSMSTQLLRPLQDLDCSMCRTSATVKVVTAVTLMTLHMFNLQYVNMYMTV